MQCRWTYQIQFPVKCIISNQWFQFNTVGLCWWTSCCYQKGAGCKERKSIRNGAGEWSHNNKWLSIIGQCEVFTRKDILRWSEHCSAKISPLHNVNPLFYRTANWCQSLSWKTWRDYLLRSLILPSPPWETILSPCQYSREARVKPQHCLVKWDGSTHQGKKILNTCSNPLPCTLWSTKKCLLYWCTLLPLTLDEAAFLILQAAQLFAQQIAEFPVARRGCRWATCQPAFKVRCGPHLPDRGGGAGGEEP